MNNYMKRLVSAKKKTNDGASENEKKARSPPSEAAMPVGTTSPIASRPKSARLRMNRLLSSSEKATEIAPSSPPREATAEKGTQPTTSNRPSPRRIRQYMQSKSTNGNHEGGAGNNSEHQSSEEHFSPITTNECNGDSEAPSKASWMALVKDSDSDINNSDNDDADLVLFQSPTQGSIPWDEGPHQSIEVQFAEVQMDREILRQQLSEARAELEIARSTLRENVSDLEHQLRGFQQSERRQAELEENALLEKEIDELARLAREQDGSTLSPEGAAASPIDPASLLEGKVEKNESKMLSQKEESHKEKLVELEIVLKERSLREEKLENEVRELKEQAEVESQKLEDAKRQVQWFKLELQAMFPQEGETSSMTSSQENSTGGDTSLKNNHGDDDENNATQLEAIIETNADDKDSSHHVKLLHEQRLELEGRVQKLMDEIGTLRQGQITCQHEKHQSDTQVVQLQEKLQQQQEQYRLELVSVKRQLKEWKGRSDLFQTNFEEERNLAEHQNILSKLEKQERQQLSERVEQLELQNNELKDSLEKNRIGSEHEKGYLRRTIKSLEKKLGDVPCDSQSDVSNKSNGDIAPSDKDSSRQTQEVLPVPQIRDHEFSKDEEAWKGLLDRIQELEDDQKARIDSELSLREQLKNMIEQGKETKDQLASAEDRVRVLQTYLDESFSASPKRDRQRELHEEYLSAHSRISDEDENSQKESQKMVSDLSKTTDSTFNSERTKNMETAKVKGESPTTVDGNFVVIKESRSELSSDPSENNSPDSRAKALKLRDTEERSINSEALVHNLHLKLEKEMGHLKKRKERRRSRAKYTEPLSDKNAGKYRSALNFATDFLQSEPKDSDADTGKASSIAIPKIEADVTTRQELPTDSDVNSEQTSMITERVDDRKDESNETSIASESLKQMQEENSRLTTALKGSNNIKAQLEFKLQDAMKQINESIDQVETLSAEIMQCRWSLEQSERGKSELTERMDIIRKEAEILKSDISRIENDKKVLEATLSKLKEDLDVKDRTIIENDESNQMKLEEMKKAVDKSILENNELHRTKQEEMKQALEESRMTREEDHANVDQINHLEAKILLIETESKSSIEIISKKLDGVVEERNNLELKFHDAAKEIDKFKQSESSLKSALRENTEKLETAQDEIQKLTQTKGAESTELRKTISDKNQRIADLEEDFSCNGRRLEQASNQLSELENELFARDEEIEKLESTRLQMQDDAIKQLVDMEKFLAKEAKEIDRLEEEKSKLQDSVQKYEHQIEKQVGRLAEASMQLSELESEIFAKDDEIEEMELKMNAMQALEAQQLEMLQDSENQKKKLEETLETAKQTIQNLTSQVEKVKQEREIQKTESQRLLVEDERKNKEIQSRQNQLNRQLQNVSKLTEQTDKWQLQLEKAYDEKQELLDNLLDIKNEVDSLRKELDESNEKIKELNAINTRLKDDLVCATEEDEKNRLRISQMEDQKEALSQKLESAVDNLADLQKQNKEATQLDERLGADIIGKLQENLESEQAVDEETEMHIRNLTEQVEFERQSLRSSEVQRSQLETENETLKNQIRILLEMNSGNSGVDATAGLGNAREQVARQLTSDIDFAKIH